MICNWLDEGIPMIICLDSTNAFISQNMLENFKTNSNTVSKDTETKQGELKEDMMGQVAKAMSKYMPIVKEKLDKTGSLMLIMSQYRDKIGAGLYDEKVYTSGGKAIEYSCDYRLQFKKGGKITKVTASGRKIDAGCDVNITVKKTRGNGLHLTCVIPFKDGIGFSDIQKQVCILAFRNALIATHHISYYACQLVELKFSYELRMIAYEILWDIACADGVLDLEEKTLLESLEKSLLLEPGTFNHFFRQRVRQSREGNGGFDNAKNSSAQKDPLSDEYEELGCSSSATDEELRSAYRNLAKRLHPDILRAQGMPEALMVKANARMARINAAWDKIKKARGIRN